MTTKTTFLLITDDTGEIIAAVEECEHLGLAPGPNQKLHRIEEVPAEVFGSEFHSAITRHFQSNPSKAKELDYDKYIEEKLMMWHKKNSHQ